MMMFLTMLLLQLFLFLLLLPLMMMIMITLMMGRRTVMMMMKMMMIYERSILTLSQTNPCFLRVCCTSLLKTLQEKEKLLVTSNFSFSRSVFYQSRDLSATFIKFETVVCKLFEFGRIHNLSFGKRLSKVISVLTDMIILIQREKNR